MAIFNGLRRMFSGSPRDGAAPGQAQTTSLAAAGAAPAEEFARLLARLSDELERGRAEAGELRQSLEVMPRIAESMSELRRQSVSLNETLSEHAEQSRRVGEATQSLLQRVGDGLTGQVDAVGAVQQQLDTLVRTFAGVGEDFERLRSSLAEIADHSSRSSATLLDLAQQQDRRERELIAELRRGRRWTLALLAVTALAAAVVAILALTRFA